MNRKDVSKNLINICHDLFPFNYSVSGKNSEKASSAYLEHLAFQIHSFNSGESLRGWKIPENWIAKQAKLIKNGKVIHDCLSSSELGCPVLCPSYKGTVNKDELLKHCSWREDLPEAIVYDWTRLYRPAKKEWGLCIPWAILKELEEGDYEINIETEISEGRMVVYDYFLEGSTREEIIFNAHNCHPYQANDDISGCAVGIEIFKHLSRIKERRYSYRLLIAPELFGPMFWAENHIQKGHSIKGCVLLKSVGNKSNLKLQKSYYGDTMIDKILTKAISDITGKEVEEYSFRNYYGNDETVFEAPGIEIPSATITRFPFPEYHTNLDTPGILNHEAMLETYKVSEKIVEILENDGRAKNVSSGLYCLSNPRYNLYRSAPEPGISNAGRTTSEKNWNLMMNCLPRDLSSGLSILEISIKYRIDFTSVSKYIKEWDQKDLISLHKNEQ